MTEPKQWTDIDIGEYVINHVECGIDATFADNREMERMYDAMVKVRDDLTEQIASLEAQLQEARAWEDVPPGEYADGYFLVHEDSMITVFSGDGSNWIVFEAPEGMRLQRRLSAAKETNDNYLCS